MVNESQGSIAGIVLGRDSGGFCYCGRTIAAIGFAASGVAERI